MTLLELFAPFRKIKQQILDEARKKATDQLTEQVTIINKELENRALIYAKSKKEELADYDRKCKEIEVRKRDSEFLAKQVVDRHK